MEPVGTLYTLSKPILHPRARLSLAIASLTNQHISVPPFTFGTDNSSPSFLAKFPLGKIPAFEGADGFLLTESNAIAQYIADIAPDPAHRAQILGRTPAERGLVQQWLWFTYQHLEPALTTLCLWRFGNPQWGKYEEEKEKTAEEGLRRWLGYLEGVVRKLEREGERKWLAGTEKVSLADLVVCGCLYSGFLLYIDEEMRREFPAVVGLYSRLLSDVEEVREFYDLEGKWVKVRKQPPSEGKGV